MCVNYQKDTDELNCVVYRYRNNIYLKDSEKELKMTKIEKLLSERVYPLCYIDVLFKRCISLDEKTVHDQEKFHQEWMFLSNEHFPIVSGSKIVNST